VTALIAGDLVVPHDALGAVIFVHGSGSSRTSPRNRAVAEALERRGFATLLLDLLTIEEARLDQVSGSFRFDVPLLADRVVSALDWTHLFTLTKRLPIGLFGASTGAAAALVAAARDPQHVRAIVSRGGRPDLAGVALRSVEAPTRLIVGSNDADVLRLNGKALLELRCPCDLKTVARATHLFEEAGALEQVAALAGEWFERYLVPSPARRPGDRQ
jgi:pimeloyl-ACP methyl ester carboxylesterase